ncbi:MAG: hypothetical protein HOF72_02925, partial [Planctomycetaceae bacterium]|nr:hypothetical protein [Planctomycetaceae bacterium]
ELLRGFSDRLVVMRMNELIVAVDICDYKTDRIGVGPEALQSIVSRYRPQIYAYKQSIAQMLALQPSQVGARLIFTHTGEQAAV